ncbi:MAG: hypothetical protein K2X77_24810 [Candidatus Obscuribacterales bacterium]|jgi:hypothetical protein|nr:hypothetical protein [Candidatus Obscuribacterales bacterium]
MAKKKRRSASKTTVAEDGGRSPGTYEDVETNTDSRPRRRRRGGSGGPFLEPGPPHLEGEGRERGEIGGPFIEPGVEDIVLFAVGGVKGRKKNNKKKT